MPRLGLSRHGQEENGLSACLALLAHARMAVGAGQWGSLAGFEQNYMIAFDHLKTDMEATDSIPEEDLPAMRRLEREQRHLARLILCRQQVIRDQLQFLDDARTHLQRVKRLSRTIACM